MQERRWYAKNVARGHSTFTRRRSRREKQCRKNARARETGACAYNRSGIINRNLLGINLASVARIPLPQVGARTGALPSQVISNARPTLHLRVHFFFFVVSHFRFACSRRTVSKQRRHHRVDTVWRLVFLSLRRNPVNKWVREREREREKSHLELNKDLRVPGKRWSATALERWNWAILEKPSERHARITRQCVRNTKEKGDWRLCPGALKFDGKGRLTRLTNWSAHDILWWCEKTRPPTWIKKHAV